MVGPISDAERASFNRKVVVGVTTLVAASSGLVAVQADASLVEAAGVTAVGLVVGYLVARFVVPSGPAPATRQRHRQRRERGEENPFADGGHSGDDDSGGTRTRDGDDSRSRHRRRRS